MKLGFWNILGGSVAAVGLLVWLLRPPARSGGDAGETLIVYCAAGLREPFEQIRKAYEAEYGVKVAPQFEASGTLLSTIRKAPERGDLYLAADESYIEQAREYDLMAETIPIGRQVPVLAVPRGNPRSVRSLDDLLKKDVKVVLANPELASIGKTFKEVATKRGQWQRLADRAKGAAAELSFVGTVTDVAQALKIGSADAGIVWESTAAMFELEVVPAPELTKARQTLVIGVLKGSPRPTAALRFARYVASRDKGGPVFAEKSVEPLKDADEWGGPSPDVPVMIGAMLKPGVEEAIKRFEDREGVQITPVYNGCGILVAQMKAGQPAEMYFSCDHTYMDMVSDRFEPALDVSRNHLMLATPKGNPRELKSLDDLTRGGLKLGFAHPLNSALGKRTDDLLKRLGLHDKVYAGNTVIHADAGHMLVNQLRAGSLDAAIVYRSNVQSSSEAAGSLEMTAIVADDAVAVQPVAVRRSSAHRYLLYRLREALTSNASGDRFKQSGFEWLAPARKP